MTQSIEHQMTQIYCFVDDFLKAHPKLANWRRSAHSRPRFTDSEVITIALLQSVFGVATLEGTYLLVARNYRSAFPHVPSYAQWLNRPHYNDRFREGATTAWLKDVLNNSRQGEFRTHPHL